MSIWELGLIALVALIVLKPKRLPHLVRQAAHWLVKARKLRDSIKAESESLLKDKPEQKTDENKEPKVKG